MDQDPEEPPVARVVAGLIAGVFFGGLAGGVAFPTLPQLGVLLGISPFLVGLILSINRFARLLMSTPAGAIIDSMGTRRPMVAGFTVQGLAPFGYAVALYADQLPLTAAQIFLASRVLWGLGSAFVFVGAFSTITHVTNPDNRGRWTGYMRGGQSLGFPSGLIFGGLFADAFGYTAAFLAAGVAGLFSAVVAFWVIPDVSPTLGGQVGIRDIPGLVGGDHRILTVGVVNFVVRFLFAGVLLSTVVLYAGRHGIRIGAFSETGVSGIVMAVSVVFASVTTVFVGRYSDGLENRALVTVPALALLAGGFLVLAFWPSLLGALVGVALIGTGVGGTNPPLLALLGDISPEDDVGKLGGVYNVFGDLGSTAGPLVALPVATSLGFLTEYAASAALVVLTAGLVAVTLLRPGVDTGRRPTAEAD
ncbi:MAG: MFS transporter [Halobacteriales archaeon]|nr:MFS transporter [Halobacteriales archaeon]